MSAGSAAGSTAANALRDSTLVNSSVVAVVQLVGILRAGSARPRRRCHSCERRVEVSNSRAASKSQTRRLHGLQRLQSSRCPQRFVDDLTPYRLQPQKSATLMPPYELD